MTGSVVTRTLPSGAKRYDATWRAGGKQKWKTFTKRKDADRFLTTVVKRVQEGSYVDVKPLLVGALLDRWLTHSLDTRMKQGLLKPSTAKSYRSIVKEHLRPAFEHCRSDRLTPAVVADWVHTMADKIAEGDLSAKSYNNLLNLLHAIVAWARHPAQAYLSHDPLIGQKRLPRAKVERDYLEPLEIAQLLKAAKPPDDTLLRLAVYTGLRRGELFALRWDDIDWGSGQDGGRVHVRRSTYQGDVTSPKTEHSARAVDAPQSVLDDLAVYKIMMPAMEGGVIFRTDTGSPLDPDNWGKRRLPAILQAAELRKIGLHTLRHTYTSLLINQGESIKYVSRQLGHASIQITADLYGHLFRETSTAAMRRLDAGMTAARDAEKAPTEAVPDESLDGR
jgi:integrase